MEPNQTISADQRPGSDIVFSDKSSKGKGTIIGMVVLTLLAVGGIGFGVWEMMDKNQEIANLNAKILELNESEEKSSSQDSSVSEDTVANENLVITTEAPEAYKMFYSLPLFNGHSDENNSMIININNGKEVSCGITNRSNGGECTISGLPEGIYKAATIFEGNGSGTEKIGFLMKDGSVWYVSVYDDDNNINTNMQAKKMDIDGFVKDIVGVSYTSDKDAPTGWYNSTIFVKDDNSFVKFDKSMF